MKIIIDLQHTTIKELIKYNLHPYIYFKNNADTIHMSRIAIIHLINFDDSVNYFANMCTDV